MRAGDRVFFLKPYSIARVLSSVSRASWRQGLIHKTLQHNTCTEQCVTCVLAKGSSASDLKSVKANCEGFFFAQLLPYYCHITLNASNTHIHTLSHTHTHTVLLPRHTSLRVLLRLCIHPALLRTPLHTHSVCPPCIVTHTTAHTLCVSTLHCYTHHCTHTLCVHPALLRTPLHTHSVCPPCIVTHTTAHTLCVHPALLHTPLHTLSLNHLLTTIQPSDPLSLSPVLHSINSHACKCVSSCGPIAAHYPFPPLLLQALPLHFTSLSHSQYLLLGLVENEVAGLHHIHRRQF